MSGGSDLAGSAESIKAIFRKADQNDTGKISRARLVTVMQQIDTEAKLGENNYDTFANALDKGDGLISYTQFVDWLFTDSSKIGASITCFWGLMSQPSRAIKALLIDSGIPFEDRHVDMMKGENYGAEFRKINPSGQCPVLKIDGTFYTETIAMMRYLALRFPDHAGKYYPDDMERRCDIDKWCDFYTAFFRPSFIKEFDVKFSCLMEKRARNEKDEYLIQNARNFQKKAMKQLEAQLDEAGGKFILGDEMTLADFVLFSEMQDLKVFCMSTADYPRAMQYEADVMSASAGLYEIHKAGSAWATETLPAFQGIMK